MCQRADVLRRLLRDEGYVLDPDDLAPAAARFPDQVRALIFAAHAVGAADAQVTTLVDAVEVLGTIVSTARPEDAVDLCARLRAVVEVLARALADRQEAGLRLRHECETTADLDVDLIRRNRAGDDEPQGSR